MGRPTSAGSRFRTFPAAGVNRRMRRSTPTTTIGTLRAAEEVGQVVVEPGQFHVPVLELLVDRRQLFVDRLELFLGRLQLLVGALQLLVAGEDLLVGRFQLLVGGVLLLDDRLEVVPHRGELLPAARSISRSRSSGGREAAPVPRPSVATPEKRSTRIEPRQPAGRAVVRSRLAAAPDTAAGSCLGLLEQDQEAAFAGAGQLHRKDPEVDLLGRPLRPGSGRPAFAARGVLLAGTRRGRRGARANRPSRAIFRRLWLGSPGARLQVGLRSARGTGGFRGRR